LLVAVVAVVKNNFTGIKQFNFQPEQP
jgi:hypothetical protein